jgi:glutamyl-Q tRNA(Asp) synthetase
MTVTRFAPSPSGRLHLGHAFAAVVAWSEAKRAGGRFLVRIDDLDQARCRAEFEQAIAEDLRWLGLDWPEPMRRQSGHLAEYAAALDRLRALGVVYACYCTRAEIEREAAAAASAPHGREVSHYPGTCRRLTDAERAGLAAAGRVPVWRLDARAAAALAGPLEWNDRRHGPQVCTPATLGDVVLGRKDAASSYHVSVVVDDAAQGVTLVTRGEDLLPSTHLHRLLQHLLEFPVPEWLHHPLVCDPAGRRLAKRHDSLSLRSLRTAGLSPAEVLERLPRWPAPTPEPPQIEPDPLSGTPAPHTPAIRLAKEERKINNP